MRATMFIAAVSAFALAVSAAYAGGQSSPGNGGWQYNPERNPNDSGFGVWSRVDGLIVTNPVGQRVGPQTDYGDMRSGASSKKG